MDVAIASSGQKNPTGIQNQLSHWLHCFQEELQSKFENNLVFFFMKTSALKSTGKHESLRKPFQITFEKFSFFQKNSSREARLKQGCNYQLIFYTNMHHYNSLIKRYDIMRDTRILAGNDDSIAKCGTENQPDVLSFHFFNYLQ